MFHLGEHREHFTATLRRFRNALYPTNLCRRRIKMSPFCKIEATLPRVLGSRGCTVAVLSMSKQEFSRLEVLLRVQSGGL